MQKFYLTFTVILLFSNLYLNAQTDLSLYLWDFEDKNGKLLNQRSKEITKEFELEFINLKCFTVLDRRDIATLKQHINSEVALIELEEIPKELKAKLELKGADGVILGEIVYDYESADYTIWVNIVMFNGVKKVANFDLNQAKLKVKELRVKKIIELVNKISGDLGCSIPINRKIQPIPKPNTAQTAGFIVGAGALVTSLITQLLSDRFYKMHETVTNPVKSMEYYDKAFRYKNIAIYTFYAGAPIFSGTGLWYGIGGLKNSKNNSSMQSNNYNDITMQHQIGITIKF